MLKGHWNCQTDFDPDTWFGFVYTITELDTGMKYLGKKNFHSYTRQAVRGRKNKKRVVKPSNWQKYTGSSKRLNEQIKLKGLANYLFRIDSLHETRGSLFYAEVERQIQQDVLRDTNYYNGMISAVKFIPPYPTERETEHKWH